MNRRKRLRLETLEDRVVLNAAPVLVRQFGSEVTDTWAVSSEGSPSVSIRSLLPSAAGYDAATTEMVEDFTGDGVDDVLVQWPDGGWGLQVNDGKQLYLMPWGESPEGDTTIVDTADFNNDGLEDILSYDKTTGDMWVSLNSLSDGFQSERWTKFTPNTEWLHLFVDDFDGDGRVDVLGGESGGGWWLAKNMETTFHNYFWGRFGQHAWQDVLSDDFTGDGLPDVAARGADNTWWMWAGTESKLDLAEYWGHWKMRDQWHNVSAADFNGDGRSDLIGRSEDGYLWIGDGDEDDQLTTTARGKGWIHRADWTNVTIVDMNGDGLPDQLGRAKDSTWWYAENTGERFQNHYWQKGSSESFVSSNFVRDEAIDISPVLNTGLVSSQSLDKVVRLTTDAQNRLVISGDNIELIGIDLKSASGSLIPAEQITATLDLLEEENLGNDNNAAPFQFFLQNTKYEITFGSLTSSVSLNGSLTLNAGWDFSGDADLLGEWGGLDSNAFIDVDDRLDSLAEPDIEYLGSNLNTYFNLNLPRRAS